MSSRASLAAKRDQYSDKGAKEGVVYKRSWQVPGAGEGICLESTLDVRSVSVTAG